MIQIEMHQRQWIIFTQPHDCAFHAGRLASFILFAIPVRPIVAGQFK